MKGQTFVVATAALLSLAPASADAFGLRGSPESMREQHAIARQDELTFMDNAAKVGALVESGGLELVRANGHFAIKSVSYPYALPEVKLFIERLASQYFSVTGEMLVVTSLTRPSSEQPRNAHELSVHPAGMAVDFRVSQNAKSREWLERTLLQLERSGVLDVTRERYPPHYHVAVFPQAYAAYVEPIIAREKIEAALRPVVPEAPVAPGPRLVVAAASPLPAGPGKLSLLLVAMTGILAVVALVFRERRAAVRA